MKGSNQRPAKKPIFLLSILFILSFTLLYENRRLIYPATHNEAKITLKCDSVKENIISSVLITIYHSCTRECGNSNNITSIGDKGHIGSVACSQSLFDYYVNYDDTVQVLDGNFKGKYVVNDKAASRKMLVDIWQPINSKKTGCYISKIKIIIKKLAYYK